MGGQLWARLNYGHFTGYAHDSPEYLLTAYFLRTTSISNANTQVLSKTAYESGAVFFIFAFHSGAVFFIY